MPVLPADAYVQKTVQELQRVFVDCNVAEDCLSYLYAIESADWQTSLYANRFRRNGWSNSNIRISPSFGMTPPKFKNQKSARNYLTLDLKQKNSANFSPRSLEIIQHNPGLS